ncbi:MAG: GntR family transcriptional regulator [Rhizobiaceae bacterium]|nr:GntR family transcriptional regulator [Rhizobiaceae bacterium]
MVATLASNVDSIYQTVRAMAAAFEFKPEERINESDLSKRLGISRTPLREALNRLVAEGLLTVQEGRGFFCRSLVPEQIVHIYELRQAIESETVMRAVERATDAELTDLKNHLDDIAAKYVSTSSAREIVELDEAFHLRIAELSKNAELVRALENLNEQIRYVRWISMRSKIDITKSVHEEIINAMLARDVATSVARMRAHIEKSTDEAKETVRTAYSQIYVPGE